MLKAFYDGLGDNENTSLGQRFPHEDEVDVESYSSDDDNNDGDNERDDVDEMKEEEECEIEDDSNYNSVFPEEVCTSGEGEKTNKRQKNKNDEADNVERKPARKQKFKNADQFMNENNCMDIPGQPKKVFRRQKKKKL